MLKRFRTSDGKLSCTLAELKEKTMPEAFEYYVPGRLYVYHGKTYILDNLGLPGERAVFINVSHNGDRLLVASPGLGTFLPDVSTDGEEISRL